MTQQINRFKFLLIGLSLGGVWLAGCDRLADAQSQGPSPVSTSQVLISDRDVPYVPTPEAVVDAMLEVAKVGKDDVLYDLGSGDGRIVITAAEKFGTRGVGIDIDPERVQEAQANARKAGVTDRTKFIQQDLFKADFSEATVVTLYLLPSVNLKLRPLLFKQLKPGTRVVSNTFDMDDWKPEKTLKVGNNTVYYWVIPEKVPENLR